MKLTIAATVFNFSEYKQYLTECLGGPRSRSGQRLAVARALNCQPTFVSQVLNGRAHFSLEQASKVSQYLKHSEDEREYFFCLLQKERAGSNDLRDYFQTKIDQLIAKRQVLVNRLGTRATISPQDQGIFYSSWLYLGIYIALTIPTLRTRDALAKHFRYSTQKISHTLDQLCSMGIVSQKDGIFTVSNSKIRLGRDSHNILKHHTNWRNQAIDSLERESPRDLHYSGVLSLSREARDKIKSIILDSLKAQLEISEASPEEELVGYCIDFFGLERD
jgi:uncharacterized protein (TIGR02147 family)